MLTRHSPLHVPGRAEVGGWLVGESDGLPHPDGWLRTAARSVRSRQPGIVITLRGARSRIDRTSARPMATKKSPRADPRDTP